MGAFCQSVSGHVLDEENNPVPFANIKIKDNDWGTTADGNGYYFIDLEQGEYDMIVYAPGYVKQEVKIVLVKGDIEKNVWLKIGRVLEEVTVKAKRRDPAYEIIYNASQNRKRYQQQFNSSRCDVYIKAVEDVKKKEKKRKEKTRKKDEELEGRIKNSEEDDQGNDSKNDFLEEEKKKIREISQSKNMAEISLIRNYQYPNQIKEIRKGVSIRGDKFGLYFLSTFEDDYNFYKNLVDAPKLSETPLISPLNSIAILNYKFKLVETTVWNEKLLFKIKVTPRRRGNATWEGFIYIVDGLFAIKEVDFYIEKGNLLIFDYFKINQKYDLIQDSIWVISSQEFNYKSKTNKENFKATTIVEYNNYEINPIFPKKYFKNEVAVVEGDAYEKDTSYWSNRRPEPLTKEEQEYVRVKDSIEAYYQSDEYLDSVDQVFNELTWEKVLLLGFGHRNRMKKNQWQVPSLIGLFNWGGIGGVRVRPMFYYFKKLENEKWFDGWGRASYGTINKDLNYSYYVEHLYNPMKRGYLSLAFGKDYRLFNPYGSYVTVLSSDNYYQRNFISIKHDFEIVNGLYLYTKLSYDNRVNMPGDYDFGWVFNFTQPISVPLDVEPFQAYQSAITRIILSYVPNQKYIREPKRKVVLGSKWPKFGVVWKKGWKNLFGSDINFDYLSFSISQSFKLSTLGTSNYNFSIGKFLNTKELEYIDNKFYRVSEPFLFSNPMRSFQMLDTNLTTTGLNMEMHYIHHFNGAILNNLPLIKKLRIKSVAGAGAMFVENENYAHAEMFFGLERVFKVSRYRFRIGTYYSIPFRSYDPIEGLKFSIEFYDNANGKWRF